MNPQHRTPYVRTAPSAYASHYMQTSYRSIKRMTNLIRWLFGFWPLQLRTSTVGKYVSDYLAEGDRLLEQTLKRYPELGDAVPRCERRNWLGLRCRWKCVGICSYCFKVFCPEHIEHGNGEEHGKDNNIIGSGPFADNYHA